MNLLVRIRRAAVFPFLISCFPYSSESVYNSSMDFSLEHLGLSAREPATLKDWYVKTLGARVVFENNGQPPFLLAFAGGSLIEIYAGDFSRPETANNKLNGWRHLAVRVASLEAAKTDLERKGVKFTDE